MPAVGHRNASRAAMIAEPFASLGDGRAARNLMADADLHVVDQEREPAGIASPFKRTGDRQSVDRWHRRLLHRQGERPDSGTNTSLRRPAGPANDRLELMRALGQ